MRIAIVVDRIYPFYVGGYEVTLHKYAEILSADHDVTIFTAFDESMRSSAEQGKNIRFVQISKRKKFLNNKGVHGLLGGFRYWTALRRGISQLRGFDQVIINAIPYIYSKGFLDQVRATNNKLVFVFFEAWSDYLTRTVRHSLLGNILKRKIGLIVRKSNFLISCSTPTTASLIKNYDANARNVITIPLGIENETNGLLDFDCKIFDLVFMGRLAKIKHVEQALQAVSRLLDKIPNIRFLIVGDGEMMQKISSQVKELGLGDHVSLLGRLDSSEKMNTLKQCKVFVLPSEREGFSISTLEAMSVGCIPIIAKPTFDEVFGPSHFVVNGKNGIYYEFGDVEQLAHDIEEVLTNYRNYREMAIEARQSALEYTWPKIATQITSAFQEMGSEKTETDRIEA